MAKNKGRRGLHKEITSIFDGVPLPKDGGHNQPKKAPRQDKKVPRIPSPPEPAKEHHEAPAVPQAATMPAQISPKPETRQPAPAAPSVDKSRAEVVVIEASGEMGLMDRVRSLFAGKLSSPGMGSGSGSQKKMIILIPILVVIFVIVFARLFSGPTGTAPIVPTGPTGGSFALSTEIDWEIPDMYPGKLRNPMQAVAGVRVPVNPDNTVDDPDPTVAVPVLEIRGILWTSDDPSALIGTEILHVGDTVDGVKITAINKKSIVFEIDGKKYEQTGNQVKSVD
jgi:hypothetical protein